jgi:hypothetical protein
MKLNSFLKFGVAAISLLGCASGALAQSYASGMVPPRRVTDARGVDLVGGTLPIHIPLVSFGSNAPGLSAWIDPGSSSALGGPIINDFLQAAGGMMGAHMWPQFYTVGSDGNPDEFGPFENIVFPNEAGFTQQLGQYPRWNPDQQSWSFYTNPDGSRYTHSFGTSHFTRFESSDPNLAGVYDAAGDRAITVDSPLGLFDTLTFANGEQWRFYREYVTVPCTLYCQTSPRTIYRLRFVTSSRGYGIQFLYQSDATPASNGVAGLWWAPRRVTAYNKAVTYCNEALLQECTGVTSLPSATITYDSTAHTVTVRQPDATDGVELTITQTNNIWGTLSSLRHTGVANSTVSFLYAMDSGGAAYISRITDSDGQWNYTHFTYVDDSGHLPLMSASSTNPAGGVVSVVGYGVFGTIQTFSDELNREYNYSDGFPFRDWGRSEPEWNDTFVDRDLRNNIRSITRDPKPNSGLSPITVYQAAYPVDCTNPRTCNHPTSETDGNSNVSTYTYAPEHGGVLTETGPLAPTRQNDGTMANVRPQKRYEYAQRYAWIANGSGGYMHGPTAIWLMTRERHCATTAASGSTCAGGAADEVVTDYDYGPDSGPNNLLLRGTAVTAYVSGAPVTRRTCYGYDSAGNRISTTQPNANLGSCP